MISTKADATSMPTRKLISAMVPDELIAPGIVPSGRKLSRYGSPCATAATPTAANPPAPIASAASSSVVGLNLRNAMDSPDR